MAAVEILYAEQLTKQTNATTSDTTAITLGGFTTSDDYLLVVSGKINNTGAGESTRVHMAHGGSFTIFTDTYWNYEPSSVAHSRSFILFTKWTAASGESAYLRFNTTSGGTAELDEMVFQAINLTDLGTDNYKYAMDETQTTLTTSWSTSNNASVTFTPDAASVWMVMTASTMKTVSEAINYESRIERSGEATDTASVSSCEGENATIEQNHHVLVRPFSLTAVSNTFQEASRIDASGSTENRRISKVFCLNLDAFADYAYIYTSGHTDLSATAYATELATVDLTPSITDRCPIFTCNVFTATAEGATLFTRVQLDDTTTLPGTPGDTAATPRDWRARDASDVMALQYAHAPSLTASTTYTIDYDGYVGATASGRGCKQRVIIAFCPELAPDVAVYPQAHKHITTSSQAVNRASLF
jgi:hypothetical protein